MELLEPTVFNGEKSQKADFPEPICLVIGNEAIGISKDILNSGTHITLDQKNSDISYNASVAAGILLYLISTKNNKIWFVTWRIIAKIIAY